MFFDNFFANAQGHIQSVDMLIDRAKNAGVLHEVLEATDNRQAHSQFLLLEVL